MKSLRVLGWFLLVTGAAVASLLVVLSVMTEWQTKSMFLIGAATFIPLLWLPSTLAIIGSAIVLRGWWRLLALALAVGAFLLWGRPLLPQEQVIAESEQIPPALTVLSLNLQYGRADVGQLEAQIRARTDLVALQEYTPAFAAQLLESGLLDEFPYQVGSEREDAGGTMLLSRTPVEIVAEADTRFHNFVARTDVDGLTWHIGVIHSTPPQLGAEAWTQDAYRVNGLALDFAGERTVLVGDFNAVDEHHPMRVLTKSPFQNAETAQERSGLDGWQPTWPVGGFWPAFARIDHVLTSPTVEAGPPFYFKVKGTDHKGLFIDLWAADEG